MKSFKEVIQHWQVFRDLTQNEPVTESMKQALFAFDDFIQKLEDNPK